MPIATVFVIGTVALGVVVVLLLRFVPRKISRVMVGTTIILAAFVLWWAEHKPRRPHTVSSNATSAPALPSVTLLVPAATGFASEVVKAGHEIKTTPEAGTPSAR
jgi:uncharacterized membrane protein YfcA